MEKERLFDWETGRVVMVGTIGNLSALFDFWAAKAITILTLIILIRKFYKVFFSKGKKDE